MRWHTALGFALAAPLVAAALGCGGGGETGTGGSGGTGTGASGPGGTGGGTHEIKCDGAPADLAVEGSWAAYGQLSVGLQNQPGGVIAICPADQIAEATMVLLMTVKQDPVDPLKLSEVKATLCSIELPTVTAIAGSCDPTSESLVTTQLRTPQALIDAFPKIPSPNVTGTLDGKAPGSALALERFVLTVGSNKTGAALPKWNTALAACNAPNLGSSTTCDTMCVDDCPGLLNDDDPDPYPGVTLEICGLTKSDMQSGVCNASNPGNPGVTLQGKAYIDIEVNPLLSGVAKSSCELVGNVDTDVLYHLVGGELRLTGQPLSVTSAINTLPTFNVDPSQSKFRMVRIDGQYGAPDFAIDPAQPAAACSTILMRINEIQ